MKIRPYSREDKAAVRRIIKNSFAFLQRWSLRLDQHVLVAEDDNGSVVGAVKCKIIDLKADHRIGLFSWICADPGYGKSPGMLLVSSAMEFFHEAKCDEIIGCIEGMNTKASRTIEVDNFAIVSPVYQLKTYGPKVLKLWFKAYHIMDFGHFLWRQPPVEQKKMPTASWWLNFLVNCVMGFLAARLFLNFSLAQVLFFVISLSILFGLRHWSMKLSASISRLPVVFRPWESSFFLGFGLASIGLFFPMPGTLYPAKRLWSYRRLIKPLTGMAFAGTISILILAWIVTLLKHFSLLPYTDHPIWQYITWQGKFLILWDLALPFYPFSSLNGQRIFERNRIVWLLLTAAAIGLFFIN